MARPPVIPPEAKTKLVLGVLSGELSTSQAARKVGVSEQAVGNWKRQFIAAGSQGLAGGDRHNSERERRLLAQIAELKIALGEAYVQLRTRNHPTDHRAGRPRPAGPRTVVPGPVPRGPAASSSHREVSR